MEGIEELYKARFNLEELKEKRKVWRLLTRWLFQRFVRPTDTVVDMGAGYCEFINTIKAKRRIAVDLNKDVASHAAKGVEVIISKATEIKAIASSSVDVVFISNLLEHMGSKEEAEEVLRVARKLLKRGGLLLIVQPNIKYAYREYWDFFDHFLPFSDKSMVEVLRKNDFQIVEIRPRFLPFSFKSHLPKWDWLIWLYIKLKPAQILFGKQMFIVAKKR